MMILDPPAAEKIDARNVRRTVRALEVKLSQGAKPGLGGMLPGVKVTEEIAEIRGIKPGVDCASPSTASIFAPPSALMPPAALISSIARVAPMRPCWRRRLAAEIRR